MKKGKIWVVGLIVLLMAGVLILAGCGEKCPDNKKCSYTAGGDEDSVNECKDQCIMKQAYAYMANHPDADDPPSLSCNCGS